MASRELALTIHKLKTWPSAYEAILIGTKTYEVRKDDRGFKVGDILMLTEWDSEAEAIGEEPYTGRVAMARIAHKTPGGKWGLPDDLCVLGIRVLDAWELP